MDRGLKFTVTVSQIDKFCILIVILLDYNFFYLIRQPSWLQQLNSKSTKILIGGLIILLALFIVTRRELITRYRFLLRMECGIMIAVVCVGFCTLLHYKNQGISSTIRIMMPYFIPLLAFPILYLVEYGGVSWRHVLGTIEKVVFIWYVVSIISFVVYQKTGSNFLIEFFTDDQITTRNAGIRMAMFSFGNVALFYNLECWLNNVNGKKLWYFMNLILGVFCVFFVQSTRMFYLADSLGMFIVLLLSGKTKKKKVRNIAIIIIVLMVLIQTNIISNFIDSILYGNDVYRYNSTEVRVGAYSYYFNAFLRNPLYALGFVSDGVCPTIAHGTLGVYNFSDVGFVGLLGQTGVFAVLIVGIPYLRMLWISLQLLKKKRGKEYSFLIALAVYFLVTSMSIIATAPAYAMILPFAYAGFEYVWKRERI